MIFYFSPKLQGDIIFLKWETPISLEKELKTGIDKKWYADLGRETGVRTPQQNNALHLGLSMIAKALNEAGLDMRKVLKPTVDIPWTTSSVKDHLWRPVQKSMTGKESTTKLDKLEPSEIWDVIMRHLGEKHGIEYIQWPSEQNKPSVASYTPRSDE